MRSSRNGDFPFPGLNLAVITPFDTEGRVDLNRLEARLKRYIAAGVDGFVLSSGTESTSSGTRALPRPLPSSAR